jgi:hypothetical protein
MLSEVASPVEMEDEDALIEQGLAVASDFLKVLDRTPAATELLFEPFAATETVAEDESTG